MSAKLWEAASVNAFSTTLNGSITASDATITLTTVANLVAPGVLVIDRQDSSGNDTASLREFITYTGISSSDLTGCSRGVAGSTAQSHSSGAIIEENMSVTHWNEMVDFLNVSHDTDGKVVISSTATISQARIYTHLDVSGASITGIFPINPTWVFEGAASLPSTSIGKPLSMPQSGVFKFFSAVSDGPASGATIIIDVNNGGTSIFAAASRLMIPAGGTYVSTASINTLAFGAGNALNVDLDHIGNTVNNVGISVTGRS